MLRVVGYVFLSALSEIEKLCLSRRAEISFNSLSGSKQGGFNVWLPFCASLQNCPRLWSSWPIFMFLSGVCIAFFEQQAETDLCYFLYLI